MYWNAKRAVLSLLLSCSCTFCAPPAGSSKYYPFPDVLPRDQSLPAHSALSLDAVSMDTAAMKTFVGQSPALPPDVGQSTFPLSSLNGAPADLIMSGGKGSPGGPYPIGMADMPTGPVMPPAGGKMPQTQGTDIGASPFMPIMGVPHQTPFAPMSMLMPLMFGSLGAPMPQMLPIPMQSYMPAPLAMMSLQMACQSLNMFVMSTPMAQEIFASVNQMGGAGQHPGGQQCGFQAMSDALRMFLKLCQTITSCPFPESSPPQPIPTPSPPSAPPLPRPIAHSPVIPMNPQPAPPSPLKPRLTSPSKNPAKQPMAMQLVPSWNFNNPVFSMRGTENQAGGEGHMTTTPSSGGSGVSDD